DIVSGNKLFRRFFKKFFAVLTDNKLNYPHPERTTIHNGKPIIWRVMTFEAPVDKLSENELLGLMEFDDGFIKDLKQKHRNVVRAIPDKPPVPFYKGKGYTMVGGGKYSWYALLSVQVLRKVGSLLPVEILIPNDDEYEAEVCENIFPLYNAKCVLMSKVFGKETLKNFELSGYQFKSFALLGSSFDDTFLLDSDTFPVMNPDPLFASPLYKHYEMITWPDFWRRTVSPRYYEVAGIEVGPKPVRHLNDFYTDSKYYASEEQRTNYKEDIPYHDREGTLPDWTTESGELLIRKSTHFNSLLLSLYYNTDGPQGYHPLLSQGGAGEGDKETFVAAAHYYNQPFYQLYKAPDRIFGWHDRSKGTWEHTTIAQYDPLNDFEILKANVKRVEEDIEREGDSYQYIYEYAFRFPWTQDNCKAMFYHVHDPKMDPFLIKEKSVNLDLDDGKIRNLGDLLPGVGFDLEGTIYRNMRYNLCEQKWKFQTFKDQDMKELCAGYLHDHIAYLEKTEKEILAKH
ncbi:glycosyltransferase family 71 protein, partial [[Candida] arabinofermentans NRRL YB-2248]